MSDGVQGADSEGRGAGTAEVAASFTDKARDLCCEAYGARRQAIANSPREGFGKPSTFEPDGNEAVGERRPEPRHVVSAEEDRAKGVIRRTYVPHDDGVIEVISRIDKIVLRDMEDGSGYGLSLDDAFRWWFALEDALRLDRKNSKGEV
jgi:hypothetical protein